MITYAPSVELNPEGCDFETCRKIIDAGPFPPVAHAPPASPPPEARAANTGMPEAPPAGAAGQPTRLPQSPDDAMLQHTGAQPAAPDVRRAAPPKAADWSPPFTLDPIDD
jgi:pyruvate/2-oxoglutarate dehydrogenase complex dihydrolipoamide acyltransferase (E2) component